MVEGNLADVGRHVLHLEAIPLLGHDKLSEEVDPDDGSPVLRVSYYRHWPRHYFVTTADAPQMPR